MLTPAQKIIAADMSEKELQKNVCDALERFGWLWYHTYDSRRSHGGFPDICAVRNKRLIFAELKGYDKRGRLGKMSSEQTVWKQFIVLAQQSEPPRIDDAQSYYLWTPDQWMSGEIEEALRVVW